MKKLILLLFSAAFGLALSSVAMANSYITPTGTYFGSLPSATFGGSGIANWAVEVTQIGNLTLGLTATPRYSNPAMTNNGAGVFTVSAGGDTLNSRPDLAKWNFDYAISGLSAGQSVRLYYDNDPTTGNDVSSFYTIPVDFQESSNLGFATFNGGTFNPTYNGNYAFALVAFDSAGAQIGVSSIDVKVTGGIDAPPPGNGGGDVTNVPDGGSTALLLSGGLLAMGLVSFRNRRDHKHLLA